MFVDFQVELLILFADVYVLHMIGVYVLHIYIYLYLYVNKRTHNKQELLQL